METSNVDGICKSGEWRVTWAKRVGDKPEAGKLRFLISSHLNHIASHSQPPNAPTSPTTSSQSATHVFRYTQTTPITSAPPAGDPR